MSPYDIPDLDEDMQRMINGYLYEIGKLNDEVINQRQGFHNAIEGYERTLQHVARCASIDDARCASIDEVDVVATYIKHQIRHSEERLENRKVRRKARTTCQEMVTA